MIDLILIVSGVSLLSAGLWLFSPALCLVVSGCWLLSIAYGKYRYDSQKANTRGDA